MIDTGLHLGLDVGSGTAKAVVVNAQGDILFSCYKPSLGRPRQVAYDILGEISTAFGVAPLVSMTCTGTGGKNIASLLEVPFVNEVICHTKGVEYFHPEAQTIIDIGGEDAKLILVKHNEDRTFYIQDFALNTVCAAGTGAFLEQQAARLGYTIQEFSKMALQATMIPSIAGRCTVFAKSDMIHLQQNGVPDYEIIAGLCFAIVRNLKTNIAKGKKIIPPLVFQGGVAANYGVQRAMRELLVSRDEDLIIPENHNVMGAFGAALEGVKGKHRIPFPGQDKLAPFLNRDLEKTDRFPPLRIPNDHVARKDWLSSVPDTEGTLKREGLSQKVYLGVDVGSVSTKLVLLEAQQTKDGQPVLEIIKVLAKTYLPTAGRPLEAIKVGMEYLYRQIPHDVEVIGVGSTGSGRCLIGDFVGADVVRNEITAQARAAVFIDSRVDTVFEIGGQDSKYIRIENGTIVDFAMNKVCAAGTGSFLEEQSVRLGIEVEEFGDLALSAKAPVKMGERCTVFMQSDLVHYQQQGASKPDLAAGLCYSIVTNYLNKVVEQRKIGGRIFFQGGTALNQGIIAAFEHILDTSIHVPEHNEVTGAIGAAILASMEHKGQSRFKGFDLSQRTYETEIFECQSCPNRCEIQKITIQGEKWPLYYGHRCEKYEKQRTEDAHKLPDLIREREAMLIQCLQSANGKPGPQIGIPRALFFQEWLPFFCSLFQNLGFEVILSEATNKRLISKGSASMVSETCLPIKAAHGHLLNLLEKGVKRIFLPQISDLPALSSRTGTVCPYVQGLPWTIESSFSFQEWGCKKLSPVLHLGESSRVQDKEWKQLARMLSVDWVSMKTALGQARQAQDRFWYDQLTRGEEILAGMASNEKAVLLIGRPYNAFDPGINMDLSKKLNKLGVLSIPLDFLPLAQTKLDDELEDMYWAYGQKILAGGYLLQEYPNLFPIFVTNFSCGPDAFILHFFQKIIGDRPFLELEIDEHTADAGVVTRLEAFWDSIRAYDKPGAGTNPFAVYSPQYRTDRILYIPPMTDHLHAFAAAFEASGVDVRLLPDSDDETLRLGRQYTKGKECLPAVLTTGDIVKTIQADSFDPQRSAFFMPAARGPCRFGLYHHLHRLVLGEMGFSQVPVYAPNQSYTLYEELGVVGKDFAKLAWKGVVAVDLLIKLLHETRPYATNRGLCSDTYQYYLHRISQALSDDRQLGAVMTEMVNAFQDLCERPVQRKPVVGIVGEIYVRSNPFANEFIVEKLEQLGVEVWTPPIGEWIHYINHTGKKEAWIQGDHRRWMKMALEIYLQNRLEKELLRCTNGWLRSLPEPKTKDLLKDASSFIHPEFEGEAILSIGKSLDYLRKDVQGIINVMPFTCMPGGVVDSLLKRVKQVKDIPMMSVIFDGQQETNTSNRLEAFVYQVFQANQSVP
jgi:predicted CoA-substrate-specific enzyme activase